MLQATPQHQTRPMQTRFHVRFRHSNTRFIDGLPKLSGDCDEDRPTAIQTNQYGVSK